MNLKPSYFKLALCLCVAFLAATSAVKASVNNIFYKLSNASTINPAATTINPPAGYPYSAVAPVAGTTWNIVSENTLLGASLAAGTYTYSANNQAASGVVKDAAGNTLSGVGLTITYIAVAATGTHNDPSGGGAGENVLQPGGITGGVSWRLYNGGGNYMQFSFAGLPASKPFDLYFYGESGTLSTSTSGGRVGLVAANQNGSTFDTTLPAAVANSAGNYGAIWTVSGGVTNVLSGTQTYKILHGITDGAGNISLVYSNAGGSYLNGFQLVQVPVSSYSVTGGGSDCASVTVGVSSSETGVSYQLYNGSTAVGSPVSGTGSAITFGGQTTSGTYTVKGTVTDGTTTGLTATMTGSASVTINAPTTISAASPASQNVSVTASVNISVTVGGTTPTTYVWKKNGMTLNNGSTGNGGSTYSGATTATLTINNVQLGDSATTGQGYTCTVSGGCGSPTSTEATLSVTSGNTPPTITGLTNQTVLAGNNATLSTAIGGTPTPTWQWYLSTNGGASSNAIAGATGFSLSSSLTLTNVQYSQNGYKYYLLASNVAGVAVSNMTLTVTQIAPTITGLTNQTVYAGNNATLSATVGGAPAPALQWLVNGTPITAATNSTLVITNVHGSQSGYVYSLTATNTAGTVTSNATLTVTSQVFCLNFDVNRNYVYQNGSAAAPDAGTNWNMLPTSGISGSFTSNNVTDSSAHVTACSITVAGSFSSWPDTTTGNPNPVNLMADYFFNGPYTITFSNLAQGTYALYDYAHGNALDQNSVVTVSAGNGGASASTTANATYTSNFRDTTAGPGVAYVVLNGTVGSSGTFTFTNASYLNGLQLQLVSAAGVSGLTNQTVIAGNSTVLVPTVIGTTPISYQWNSNGVAIANATNSTLPLNSVQYAQNGTVYSLVASNPAGADTNSMMLTVIVTPAITGLNNQAAPVGNTVSIPATVSGVPTPAFKWLFNGNAVADGATGNGSTIAGSASSTLTINNAQAADSGIYSLVASNAAGVVTNTMTLTVSAGNVAPFMTGPTDQNVVQTSNATFTASVSGLPVPALQWRVNGANIAGATTSSLTISNVQYAQNGYVYSLVASNVAGMTTNSASLIVLVPPAITQQPTNLAVIINTPATFSVTASGVPAVKYQWIRNGSVIPNATNASYTISSAQGSDNGATFSVAVSNSVAVVTSSNGTLTVLSTMAGAFLPTNNATGISPDQQLRIVFSGGTPKLGAGKLYVRNVADDSIFATIDTSQFITFTFDGATVTNGASRNLQGINCYYEPIAIEGNVAWVTFTNRFAYNKTYYVTADAGLFRDGVNASFPAISGTNMWRFSTKSSGPATPTASTGPTNITVGLDGAGDFATLQGASDWIPQNNTLRRNISIQPGTYRDYALFEQNRNTVTISGAGASPEDVLLYYPWPTGGSGIGVLTLDSSDINVLNLDLDTKAYLTFPGRMRSLISTGNRLVFENVLIKGGQDTLYTVSGSAYFKNCEVWGSVDFIYGAAVAVFDQCAIVEIRDSGGPITAPNTPYAQPYGLVFLNCSFPQATIAAGHPYNVGAANTTFQRAWGQDGMTAIINCAVGSQISTAGWSSFGYGGETTCRAREYGTTLIGGGTASTIAQRQAAGAYWLNTIDPDYTNNPSLNPTNALLALPNGPTNRVGVTVNPVDYTLDAIFGHSYFGLGSWRPAVLPLITSHPTNQTVNVNAPASFNVTAIGVPEPVYQWLKNGANLLGQTNATLTFASVQASNVGTYSVLVSNSVGSVTSSNATLQINGSIAPVLTVQPTNQTVAVGGTAVFTVVASGVPAPTYQWLKNGTSLLNATNATLTLANVQVTDIGVYSLIAANSAGTATSVNAALTLTGGKVQLPAINLDNIIVVTNSPYNAAGDGATDNTTAIQNAINKAATGGLTNGLRGGTVEIPAGTNTYLCGPLNFSNNVNLQLDAGAILQLLPYDSYPGAPTNTVSFITGSSLTNIAITGLGMIDGQGSPWWAAYKTNSRPVILYLPSCSKALFRDFTITNPPATHIAIKGANAGNINFIGIKLFAPSSDDPVNPSHNTDGVDFAETNAVFQDCFISTGDDNIAMGSSGSKTADILITNCFFGEGHGCSIGSYTSGGVSNLTVISCTFSNTGNGIKVKSARDRGGIVQNLNYYNITMTNVDWPIQIYPYYEFGLGTLTTVTPEFAAYTAFSSTNPVPYNPPIFRNITISNVTANVLNGRPPLMIWGLPDYPVSNVVLQAVTLNSSSTRISGIYNVTNVQIMDCSFPVPAGTDSLQCWNADLAFTNSASGASAWVLDGITTNGVGSTFEFFRAPATFANSNTIAGGAMTVGNCTVTVSNNLALTTATPLNYVVGTNPATLVVKGNLTSGGIVNVAAGTGFTNGTYTLITYTGSLSGAVPALGTTPPGYAYSFDTATSGIVKLVVTLLAPTNLMAAPTNMLINLKWNSVSGATSYNLKRGTVSGNYPTIFSGLVTTNFGDANVTNAINYYYVVTATGAGGESSNSLQAVAASLPSNQPTNILVQASAGQMQLSWPQDHLGWRLQAQTNNLASGLGTNWVTVPNSTNATSAIFSISASNGSTFFRLVYP